MPEGSETHPFNISFFHTEDGILHADWKGVPPMPGGAEAFFESLDMWLLPASEGSFVPGEAYDGKLRETWAGFFFEFEPGDGANDSFILLDEFDQPFARGRRIN